MTATDTSTTGRFEEAAGTIAMKAAADYFARYKVECTDHARACELIKAHVKAAIHAALADAKEALDAGMPDVAAYSFSASIRLAGIAAAKEYAGHS